MVKQKGLKKELLRFVLPSLLVAYPMSSTVLAQDSVNVYDFRSGKGNVAPAQQEQLSTDQMDAAGKKLLAEEEELIRKLSDVKKSPSKPPVQRAKSTAVKDSKSEKTDMASKKKGDSLEDALAREKEILAQLEAEMAVDEDTPETPPTRAVARKPEPKKQPVKKAEKKEPKTPSVLKVSVPDARTAAKNKPTSLSDRMKSQKASLKKLQASKSRINSKISSAEQRIQKLVTQLEDAQNRLLIAETEVERLTRVLQDRNEQSLSLYRSEKAAKGGNVHALKPAKVVASYGEREITADMPIATVVVKKANLRTGPGLNNSPLMTVSRGTRLAIETRRGDWYRVIAPSGSRAWVSSEVVEFGKNNQSGPTRTLKVKGYDSSVEEEAFKLISSDSR